MFILDSEKRLEVLLGSSANTSELDLISSYSEIRRGRFSYYCREANTNGTNPVVLVNSPETSLVRLVTQYTVFNKDNQTLTVTVQLVCNGIVRIISSGPLEAGKTLIYLDNTEQ